jgi:hypothetical protein
VGKGTGNELGRVWKNSVMTCFMVLSRCLPGVNEVNPVKLLVVILSVGQDFEFGTFRVSSCNGRFVTFGESTRACVLPQSFDIIFITCTLKKATGSFKTSTCFTTLTGRGEYP